MGALMWSMLGNDGIDATFGIGRFVEEAVEGMLGYIKLLCSFTS